MVELLLEARIQDIAHTNIGPIHLTFKGDPIGNIPLYDEMQGRPAKRLVTVIAIESSG